jgi:hypothetical protein
LPISNRRHFAFEIENVKQHLVEFLAARKSPRNRHARAQLDRSLGSAAAALSIETERRSPKTLSEKPHKLARTLVHKKSSGPHQDFSRPIRAGFFERTSRYL